MNFRITTTLLFLSISIGVSHIAQAESNSSVGTWVYEFDDYPGDTSSFTCKNNGRGSVTSRGKTYPARCIFSGADLKINSWCCVELVNQVAPAVVMQFTVSGDHISGTGTGGSISGKRKGTQGKLASYNEKAQKTQIENKASDNKNTGSPKNHIPVSLSSTSECNGLPQEGYSDGSHLTPEEFDAKIKENIAKRRKLEEEYYARCGKSNQTSRTTIE